MSDLIQKSEPPPTRDAKVNQTIKWLLSGATHFDILEAIRSSYPGDDPAKLILDAMRLFEQAEFADARIVHGWCFEATKDLYRRMVEIGDYPGALKAVKQLSEMVNDLPIQIDAIEAEMMQSNFALDESSSGHHN